MLTPRTKLPLAAPLLARARLFLHEIDMNLQKEGLLPAGRFDKRLSKPILVASNKLADQPPPEEVSEDFQGCTSWSQKEGHNLSATDNLIDLDCLWLPTSHGIDKAKSPSGGNEKRNQDSRAWLSR